MAQCPKCGKKLRLTQWRPECPFCGVNMVYYKANDRLLAETEQAEIEHAKNQPGIDRAKAAFFGSPPALVRVALSVLPIAALFLPLVRCQGPAGETSESVIGIVSYLMKAGAETVLGGAAHGDPLALSILLLLLSAVLLLVCIICLPMSLGKHGKQRNLILNLLLLGSAGGAALIVLIKGEALAQALPDHSAVALSYGAYIYLFLLLVILVCNLVLAKKGLRVKYTVCYIGGLPSDEYFALVDAGVSDLEIRKKMVDALTVMQNEVRQKAAEDEEKERNKRAARK